MSCQLRLPTDFMPMMHTCFINASTQVGLLKQAVSGLQHLFQRLSRPHYYFIVLLSFHLSMPLVHAATDAAQTVATTTSAKTDTDTSQNTSAAPSTTSSTTASSTPVIDKAKSAVLSPAQKAVEAKAIDQDAQTIEEEAEDEEDEWTHRKQEYSILPITKHGQKWRIGYYHGGPYGSYQKSLIATVQGLMELGWVESAIIPPQEDPKAVAPLWEWMVNNLSSQYIEFVADAFYSPKWDSEKRVTVRQELLDRLNKTKDIDLMIVMGTWSGQDIANNEHSVPSIVGSTTDALAANIIKSVEDSGYDHIHAKIDPTRHERQVWLFREIIGFQKLGIVYEDSQEGRSFGGIASIERIAEREHFELLSCHAKNKNMEPAEAEKRLVRCFRTLAKQKADAVYIARHPSANLQNLPARLEPLFIKHIPTFSQTGADEVKHGVLLSMALSSFRPLGLFYANVIAKIFNGAKPRNLPQLFESPPKIAINLATAKAIEYDPPVEILGAADIIYQEIATPPAPKPKK